MLTLFRVVFGLLCCWKAIDLAARAQALLEPTMTISIVVLWLLLSVALIFGLFTRVTAGLLLGMTVFVAVVSDMGLYNQHLYLIGSICAILVINRSVAFLLKVQLTIVYAFAALTKVNESFLSGSRLDYAVLNSPFSDAFIQFEVPAWMLITASFGAVAVEAFLAVGLWFKRSRWFTVVIGVGFHIMMIVAISGSFTHVVRLSVFGLLMLALYLPFFADEIDSARNRIGPQAKRNALIDEPVPILVEASTR